MNLLKCRILLALLISNFTIVIVSLVTSDWIHDNTAPISIGLWKICGNETCVKDYGKGYVKATQAFHILASICLAIITIPTGILVFSNEPGDADDKKGISSAFSLSGIFLMVSMIVYTASTSIKPDHYSYGYSFMLGWISCGLCIISAFYAT